MKLIRLLMPLAGVLILAGCASPELPTFDAARDEAHIEMQKIVDRIPASAVIRVDDPRPDFFYYCDDNSAQYTGQWFVYVTDDFDIQAWMDELEPSLIAEGYRAPDLPEHDWAFSLYTPENNLYIGVDNEESSADGRRIQVSGGSVCAQLPESDG